MTRTGSGWLASALLAALLTGCGLKGGLYFPAGEPPAAGDERGPDDTGPTGDERKPATDER